MPEQMRDRMAGILIRQASKCIHQHLDPFPALVGDGSWTAFMTISIERDIDFRAEHQQCQPFKGLDIVDDRCGECVHIGSVGR